MMKEHIKLVVVFFALGCSVIEGNRQHEIDITPYNPHDENTFTFHRIIDLSNGSDEIVVRSNSTNYTGFYVVQGHSQLFNISLTHKNDTTKSEYGYNIGLVQHFQGAFEHFFAIDKSTSNDSILLDAPILIAVAVYDEKAPVPGGRSEDANPILEISNSPDIITVKAELPYPNNYSLNGTSKDVQIEIYHKYLPSQDFSMSEYYQGIISMLSIDQVKRNGRLAAILEDYSKIEAFFSTYIGTGEVFSVLVYKNGTASGYIPAVSYGEDINCLIEKKEKGTDGQDVFIVLFSTLPFVSLIIIYAGHCLFHFTTFLLGLSCGTIISFFLLSTEGATTVDRTFLISLLFGVVYGLVWLGIWYKLGIPLLSATLAFLHAGALFTSMIYHFGVADDINFHNNAIYWIVFFGIVFMCWFSLSLFTMHGHILSCCFLGSYILMITTLNYWMGGNLQYILINVYRRMIVSNFNVAILQPPFQTKDYVIALIGIIFLLHGFKKQVNRQFGKPPFPPHQTFRGVGERSPLLGHF